MFKDYSGIFQTVCDSTMEMGKALSEKAFQEKKIFVTLCKFQKQGRGRRGAIWTQASSSLLETSSKNDVSEFAHWGEVFKKEKDILPFTLVVPFSRVHIPHHMLSVAVGCALTDVFEDFKRRIQSNCYDFAIKYGMSINKIALKLPNDIHSYDADTGVSAGKISGILCEAVTLGNQPQHVLIGIGINFLFAPESVEGSTSLFDACFQKSIPEKEKKAFFNKNSELFAMLAEDFCKSFEREFNAFVLTKRGELQIQSLVDERVIKNFLTIKNQPEEKKKIEEKPKPTDSLYGAWDLGNTRAHVCIVNERNEILFDDAVAWQEGEEEFEPFVKKIALFIREQGCKRISFKTLSVIEYKRSDDFIVRFLNRMNHLLPELQVQNQYVKNKDIFSFFRLEEISYDGDLGVDRALQYALSVRQAKKMGGSVLWCHAGTAASFWVVDERGLVQETLIIPGLQLALNALHQKTDRLPAVDWQTSNSQKKIGTEYALTKGALSTVTGTIIELLLRYKPKKCIVSGGNRSGVFEHLQNQKDNLGYSLEIEQGKESFAEYLAPFVKQHSTSEFLPPKPVQVTQSVVSKWVEKRRQQATHVLLSHQKNNTDLKIADFRKLGGRIENLGLDLRIDAYMAKFYPFLSRQLWSERVENGEVRVQMQTSREPVQVDMSMLTKVKPTYRIKSFDQVWFFQPAEMDTDEPNLSCEVIEKTQDYCLLLKPADMVIHATGQHFRNTVIDWLKKNHYSEFFPVHRLDKETSGLLLCAGTPLLRRFLSESFKLGTMRKMYLAVSFYAPQENTPLRIQLPIGAAVDSKIRLKQWVCVPDALEATTDCVPLASSEKYTVWACFPRTGRTNQIRIHLAACGFPLVGDKMYNPNENVFLDFYDKGLTPFVLQETGFKRHLLHSTILQSLSDDVKQFEAKPFFCHLAADFFEKEEVKELLLKADIQVDSKMQQEKLELIYKQYGDEDSFMKSNPKIVKEI